MLSLKVNNSPSHSDGERVSPIRSAQLCHDVLEVHLDGQLADEEFVGDVTVPLTAANLPQDLDFALAENLHG